MEEIDVEPRGKGEGRGQTLPDLILSHEVELLGRIGAFLRHPPILCSCPLQPGWPFTPARHLVLSQPHITPHHLRCNWEMATELGLLGEACTAKKAWQWQYHFSGYHPPSHTSPALPESAPQHLPSPHGQRLGSPGEVAPPRLAGPNASIADILHAEREEICGLSNALL